MRKSARAGNMVDKAKTTTTKRTKPMRPDRVALKAVGFMHHLMWTTILRLAGILRADADLRNSTDLFGVRAAAPPETDH
jgi:hypothetical protein